MEKVDSPFHVARFNNFRHHFIRIRPAIASSALLASPSLF
jgi:hypothetical protein